MPTLLEQLIREDGDEVARKISSTLGISREEAAALLPATATAIFERFETDQASDASLDGILEGSGAQLSETVGARLGIAPEQAARVVPLLVPVVLRFLLRRVPYGGMAFSVLSSTVEKQGYGSLDALALRLANRVLSGSAVPGQPAPSVATRLGRWAGKWFPSGED